MDSEPRTADAVERRWRPMWQLGWTFDGLVLFPFLLIAWEMTQPPGNFAFVVVVWALVVLLVPWLPQKPVPEPFSNW